MVKRKILVGMVLLLGVNFTGCYPDGTKQPENGYKNSYTWENDNGFSELECELDNNLCVKATVKVKREAEWMEHHAVLKGWKTENIISALENGRTIAETKSLPNMHNDEIQDEYIYWEDGSMLSLQPGTLQYFTERELKYSYLGYLYGTMPYLTEETSEKFPETDIPGVDKETAIEQMEKILQNVGIQVSEPRVYSLTCEKLEENTDYSQTDPDGNPPHHWDEEDAAYAIVYQGSLDSLPVTEIGYRSGPAAGERIVGIVGKQGLVAFQALNIYEIEEAKKISEEIVDMDTILNNIQNKFRNILITDKITVDKISLEYVPVLEDVKRGEYKLKPMYVCMARQEIEHTQNKEENNTMEENSIFPIIFDAQTGMEIQTGGTF